jgi:hypothetical protein
MRIADSWKTQQFRTIVYTLETTWYVEFEAGPMKQGYKFSKEKFPALTDVKTALSTEFNDAVYEHFNNMYLSLKQANG